MYLSHETKLLGLYENMWPIPVVGVNLATSEYMDFPLKMERKILYSRDGEACDSTQTSNKYANCIEKWAIKRYQECHWCPKGLRLLLEAKITQIQHNFCHFHVQYVNFPRQGISSETRVSGHNV